MSLEELLKDMDIPEMRRDISKPANVRWLLRNLSIRNRGHKGLQEALSQLRKPKTASHIPAFLDEIGYGNPAKKHVNRIADVFCDTEACNLPEDLPELPFPQNSSEETKEELEYLFDLQEEERPFMGALIRKADKDLKGMFFELCASYQIDSHEEDIEEILKQLNALISVMKLRFNRARPFQIAPYYHISLFPMESVSAWSGSYPSGHTMQAEMLARLYSDVYPELEEEFDELAKVISHTRLVGGFHYPSDIEYAEDLIEYLWESNL